MANRIFPLLLGGAQVDIAADANWNGTTSVVRATASCTFTVGDATVPGTLLNVASETADDVLVSITTDPYGTNKFDEVTLTNIGEFLTLMWTGSAWIILASSVASS